MYSKTFTSLKEDANNRLQWRISIYTNLWVDKNKLYIRGYNKIKKKLNIRTHHYHFRYWFIAICNMTHSIIIHYNILISKIKIFFLSRFCCLHRLTRAFQCLFLDQWSSINRYLYHNETFNWTSTGNLIKNVHKQYKLTWKI